MSTDKPIQKLANAVRNLLTRHIQANTAEDDARREAERDERVRAALAELAREGKLPPPASASPPASGTPVQHAALDEAGADPAVTPWVAGVDIQGSKHLLRITGDSHVANTYDSEDVWVVLIDPPPSRPYPIWQPQIVLRDEPRTTGPWLSADAVLVCSVEDKYYCLDLTKASRQTLGWGLPAPGAKSFARVSGPGVNITELEIIDTRTGHVHHTIDTRQLLKPLAFDPTGRALACVSSSHVVVIDSLAGKVIEQISLAALGTPVARVTLPVKEQLLIHTGNAEPQVMAIHWPDQLENKP